VPNDDAHRIQLSEGVVGEVAVANHSGRDADRPETSGTRKTTTTHMPDTKQFLDESRWRGKQRRRRLATNLLARATATCDRQWILGFRPLLVVVRLSLESQSS